MKKSLLVLILLIMGGFLLISSSCNGDDDDENVAISDGDEDQDGEEGESSETSSHNAGKNCLSCHTGEDEAPKLTLAGTVYTNKEGTAGNAGVSVKITDSDSKVITLTSDDSGNFYTNETITTPIVSVHISKDSLEAEMPYAPSSTSCNSCHTDTASQGKIHLP